MSDPAAILARLDQIARDQKTRDEALLQSFRLLTEALRRMQSVMDDVHAAATKEPPNSGVPQLLEEIKQLLVRQPGQIAAAVEAALKQHGRTGRRGP